MGSEMCIRDSLGMYKDTSEKDSAADALAKAKELLGGVDSAID